MVSSTLTQLWNKSSYVVSCHSSSDIYKSNTSPQTSARFLPAHTHHTSSGRVCIIGIIDSTLPLPHESISLRPESANLIAFSLALQSVVSFALPGRCYCSRRASEHVTSKNFPAPIQTGIATSGERAAVRTSASRLCCSRFKSNQWIVAKARSMQQESTKKPLKQFALRGAKISLTSATGTAARSIETRMSPERLASVIPPTITAPHNAAASAVYVSVAVVIYWRWQRQRGARSCRSCDFEDLKHAPRKSVSVVVAAHLPDHHTAECRP